MYYLEDIWGFKFMENQPSSGNNLYVVIIPLLGTRTGTILHTATHLCQP